MDSPPQKSLREKWVDHWDKRNSFLSPSKQMNVLGMLFFWCFTASLMYTSLWILIPQLFSGEGRESTRYFLNMAIYFIFIQSSLNWVLAARPWPSRVQQRSASEDSDLSEGWKNCLTCQMDTPPRAHHCKICNMCVLKRDHHCFFTGTCVGFRNQRNFIVFIFYISIGSAYGIALLTAYLFDLWPMLSSQALNFIPFVGFWKLVTGYMYAAHFLLLMQFYVCCLMLVVAGWFFFLEMYTVVLGITWHEAEKGSRKYQGTGTASNLRSVFGPFWLVQFVLPVPTTQEADAYKWETRKGTKSN